jgi:ribonuclease III
LIKRNEGHAPLEEEQGFALEKIQKSINYHFKRLSLLEEALTHRSYANEHPENAPCHNERLEFLGDAVLNLALSALLLKKFPDLPEGALSKIRAGQVNEKKLSKTAILLDLGHYLLIGRGEEITAGRQKPSLLANAFEAVLGAVFLDGGFKSASKIISRLFLPHLEEDLDKSAGDYKTLLQEYCQGRLKKVPLYRVLREEGPDHKKVFLVEVKVTDQVIGTGKGKTKKEAQQKAAKKALLQLEPKHQAQG